jgi:hypothetical protein
LNYVDKNLKGDSAYMIGGGNSTEPYDTYETMLNNVFGYTRFIFGNNELNKKNLSESIDALDKCRQYKDDICKTERESDIEQDIEPDTDKKTFFMGFDQQPEEEERVGVLLRKGDALV